MNRLNQKAFYMAVATTLALLAGPGWIMAENTEPTEGKKLPERSEIDKKYLWATETIFPDKTAWEKEFTTLEAMIKEVSRFKGTLNMGADELYQALAFRDELEPRLERLGVYCSLLSDQDKTIGENQALDGRVRSLMVTYGSLAAWFEPELSAIPQATINDWMAGNKKLALYRQYFDNLFRLKKYILTPREEELMALSSEACGATGNAYDLLANADIKFPKIKDENNRDVELDDSAYYLYMRNNDRRVRKEVYEAIVGTYGKYRNTAGALLNGAAQSHIFNMRARGYESCLAAALSGSNIPVGVYQMLVKTVNDNLPLLHRYMAIRKRALGLQDGVHAYDLFAPLISGQKDKVSYEEAIRQMMKALQPLGDAYLQPLQKGLDSRWVEVFPTKGKRSGAYASGTYLTHPFVLLNFHGGFEDTSTLAHEMGHAMHGYFSRAAQPYVYSSCDIFCAEVASTCNEILLQNYILKRTTDPKVKLYLITEFLEQIRGTVFRQTKFSEFEGRFHDMAEKGQPLTGETLSQEYRKIMKKYYGPDYVHDDVVDNMWIRIPHFYYNFYVYKYATSYCAASNIAHRIMAGEPGAVEAYLRFLQSGRSKYPVDLLKDAGVDMTTSKPYEDGMRIFKELLDQAEQLVAQVGVEQPAAKPANKK